MKGMDRAIAVALLAASGLTGIAHAEAITADGQRLQQRLDRTNVEHLWPAGTHVDWETGQPDGRVVSTGGKHTHCSAFVAAEAKQLGVYVLRPPEHSPTLLANAQSDWLGSEGLAQGWQPIADELAAQAAANRGQLVVAVYRNHHDDHPGHIAIVRPSAKDAAAIQADGPEITQAGLNNYLDTTLRQGFAGHPAAWGKHEVRYYAHAVDWRQVGPD